MSDFTLNPQIKDRLREALDWTIFSLGVLSLSTAIVATVVTKTDIVRFEATNDVQTDVLSG